MFSNLLQLLINLTLATGFLLAYIKIWKICHNFINNKVLRATVIGIVTPFLFFGLIVNLVSSIIYFSYTINGTPEVDTSSGALLGTTIMLGVPVSMLLGFLRAVFVLINKSITDEIIRSMKNDIYNLLKKITSTKNK